MPTVSAIIPTWNRADLVRSLLACLRAQTWPPDQIIVVDNGSTDDTANAAHEFGAHRIGFSENRGFAVAINEGIRQATGEWILLLNNDVVFEPGWMERLLSSALEENASFAAGKIRQQDQPGKLDGSFDLLSRGAYAWRCGYGRDDGPAWSIRRRIFFAPMTAAIFHRRVFEAVGLLETRFESYYEDVDFGVRCALAGIWGIYEPAAEVLHLGKATLGKRGARVYFLSARNQVLLLAKHYPARTLRRFAWPVLAGQLLALFAATRQGHPLPAIRGKWEALRRWSTFREKPSLQPESQEYLPSAALLEAALSRSEREILELQKETGFDIYWRLYFSLVKPG